MMLKHLTYKNLFAFVVILLAGLYFFTLLGAVFNFIR